MGAIPFSLLRAPGTTRGGGSWSDIVIKAVWQKAEVVPGYDPNQYRRDRYGWWIQRDKRGDTGSQYGWEIDHIMPVAHGGTDVLVNLQPLHWQNNRAKGDKAA